MNQRLREAARETRDTRASRLKLEYWRLGQVSLKAKLAERILNEARRLVVTVANSGQDYTNAFSRFDSARDRLDRLKREVAHIELAVLCSCDWRSRPVECVQMQRRAAGLTVKRIAG